MTGTLDEAYLTELQERELPEGQQSLFEDYEHTASTIAVVSKPTGGITDVCDEFLPELGMPVAALEEFQKVRAQMDNGYGDAHNKAFDELNMASRYRNHLKLDSGAQDAVSDIVRRLSEGEDITLVCFEKAPKRCHRHILKDHIEDLLREVEV